MLKRIFILVIILGLSLKCWAIHPIKISTCIVTQYNGEISVNLHFFADDFGAHLIKVFGKVNLENDGDTDANVLNYIKCNFNLKINNSNVKLVLLGHTLKDNVYRLKFKANKSVKYVEGNTSVELSDTLLLEAFDDQTNIVRIDLKGDGNYRTLEFKKGRETQKIKI